MKSLVTVLGLLIALTLTSSAFAGMNALKYKGGDLGEVTFDGKAHNTKLGPGKCMECHKGNTPFAMKKPGAEGSTKITKADHVDGKFCGVCHNGTKAFAWKEGSDCTKCHKKAAAAPAVAPAVAPVAVPAPAATAPAPAVAPAPEKK
ncbi:MAG: c(7)-type cytochrome triheme domain-containing protein [Thermodesulfovibrionales bacterium]|jgi:c(7)-type cytochrome triheme protein